MNAKIILMAGMLTLPAMQPVFAARPEPVTAATPGMQIKVGKSYLNVGETTQLKTEATAYPKSYRWILPSGLELASGSLTDREITVRAKSEGQMLVGMEVENTYGKTVSSFTALDVLSSDGTSAITNALRGATLLDYSGSANPNETPVHIVDGVTNPSDASQKWCVSGQDNWALFDCGEFYRFYGFRIYDCCSGPEQNENIRDWRIEVSDDAEAWTVINEGNGTRINIKENYCLPVRGRYVKLIATPATNTMRLWEFEAIAASAFHLTLDVQPQVLRLNIGESSEIKVKYDLNGDKRSDDFSCHVSTSTAAAVIGEISDNGSGEFTIPVTGGKVIGQTDLTIRVTNDGAYREIIVPVIIDATGQPNILAGKSAELRSYAESYADGVTFTTTNNSLLTDGDALTNAFAGGGVKPASNTNDFMALFNSGNEAWELSKVEITLPQGHATKSLSIIVGSDLTSFDNVHTIDNISSEATKLEYIFPVSRRARYLGILCNTEIGQLPAIAEVEAYEQVAESKGLKSPLKVSGWLNDVIAESLPSGAKASSDLDLGGGWHLYSAGVQTEGAIAGESREFVSEQGTLFELGEYNKKNAARVGFGYTGWKADLVVEESVHCSEIHILALSANGENNLETQITYWVQDPEFPDEWSHATSETIYLKIPDWTAPAAANHAGIVGRINGNDDRIESSGVHLYEFTIKTDPDKMISNIKFANRNRDSVPTVLAISKVVAQQQSGISSVESNNHRTVIGYYDIQGRKMANPSKGINIVKYSDGTAEKVLLK